MPVLVGIDEAGYGPVLGPLVVSSVSFRVQPHHLDADWWQLLEKSVSKQKTRLLGRLLIDDSKKAYCKSAGIKHLQRATLACRMLNSSQPSTLHDLLSAVAPDCIDRLNTYPWHKNPENTPLSANFKDIAIAASAFKNNLQSNGISLIDTKTCCLDVAYYNKLVDSVKNKANVLFTAAATLIKHAFDTADDKNIQIIVDRQGGRTHYRKNLQTMFPNLDLTILKESENISSYQLASPQKTMRIHFTIKADDRFLPVSLASMQSKYIRELLVDDLNRYFQNFCPELKPTAGYWTDGLRFIDDLKKYLPHVEYQKHQMIRSR